MIKLNSNTPKRAIKALIKQKPLRSEIDVFKANLIALLDKLTVVENQPSDESEEHLKNNVRDFLRDTFYKDTNALNTKDKKDLVLHLDKTTQSPVGVIFEAKRPSNTNEMLSIGNANKKSFHELVLYYMQERHQGNNELKQLVITDVLQWFVFDANEFDKHIYRNTAIKKLFETKLNDKKDNPWFYDELAKLITKLDTELNLVYFNLKDYETFLRDTNLENDKELISLQKLFSPTYLLKQSFTNDSNSLNEKFYKELLHLMGLEETKEGGKLVIKRKEKNRQAASLIELTIDALQTEDSFYKVSDLKSFGTDKEEQTFNIALELCITWVNRILFLKLLEGQLYNYHKANKDYLFLNTNIINDYDELFKLFHKVLAVNINERTAVIQTKYSRVPYLNSSLFEISALEDQTIKINALDNNALLELHSGSVLKDTKKQTASLPSLHYLFNFLDAYDFAGEGNDDIKEDSKTIINASVLGKVFEKINGYKDGSIFTPAFITMYMCRQSIRMAVVQKFKEYFIKKDLQDLKADSIEEIYEHIIRKISIHDANDLINSIKICDPAVGSGHFLVSALNEIISIKADLGILCDETGKTLRGYSIDIIDDELFITDENGSPFIYNPLNKESQRMQKALFLQKQAIIENGLFGVDINPKSVLICRLRLWIELLKNMYYKSTDAKAWHTADGSLETLPNIDINIKCGNSLLSRFALNADLSKALKSIKYDINAYRGFVNDYKNEKSRDVKRGLLKLINDIKTNFKTEITKNLKEYKELVKLQYEYNLLVAPNIFKDNEVNEPEETYGNKGNIKKSKERIKRLEADIALATQKLEDIKNNAIYRNAFEWRFEFPEVLNDAGDFLGFDVVIGNPPYGVSIKDQLRDELVLSLNKVPDFEIYYFFINLSKKLLKPNGIKSFIIPNSILFNVFAKAYRENLFNEWQIQEILDCTDFNVFEGSATVRCIVTLFLNSKNNNKIFYRPTAKAESFEELISRDLVATTKDILLANNQNWALVFKLDSFKINLISKIRLNKKNISDYFPEISQGLIAYDKYQGQDETTIKNRVYHSNKKQTGWKKWLWGEDVTPYSVSWNGNEFINYSGGIANPREPKFFSKERILIREITNPKIFVGYTKEELYNDPAIINVLSNKTGSYEIKTLLGILNSKLATFFHFNSSPKATKGAFPKILVEDIKKFPLPNISKKEQQKIITLVDKILLQKQQGKETSAIEKQIDELVYQLYELTPEEIKIIEGAD